MNDQTLQKNILLVEDEQSLQNAIRIKLERVGFRVWSARTVQEALDHLGGMKQVDAIWLDHYLLGAQNGLDFVVQLKMKNSEWKEVPIYLVSNTATANKVQSYMQLGVNKYYTKADHPLKGIVDDIKMTLI